MRDEDDQLYIYQLYGISTPRKIKADKTLRAKIGISTKITPKQIKQAQDVISYPKKDFSGYALQELLKIEGAVQAMYETTYDRESDYELIIVPLSNIKGQAGMFGNWLASHLSEIILKFLEKYQRLDDHALDILINYCKAIRLTYELQLFDTTSTGGQKIAHELQYAIKRYNERFEEKINR
jgi:hypothetical protein